MKLSQQIEHAPQLAALPRRVQVAIRRDEYARSGKAEPHARRDNTLKTRLALRNWINQKGIS